MCMFLPSSKATGTLSATAISGDTFTPCADPGMAPSADPSAMPRFAAVKFTFGSGATGTMTLTRSTDGTTYAPIKTVTGQAVVSSISASGTLNIVEYDKNASWRIEAALTAGSVAYEAAAGQDGGSTFPQMDPATRYTSAQLQTISTIKGGAVADGDIAGDLTLYKRGRANTFIKLLVPSAVGRRKSLFFGTASGREIVAASAQVVSVLDRNGATVATAQSLLYPAVTYSVGQQITAKDLVSPVPTQDFASPTVSWGLHGFLTLWEAVTSSNHMAYPPVNTTALGL